MFFEFVGREFQRAAHQPRGFVQGVIGAMTEVESGSGETPFRPADEVGDRAGWGGQCGLLFELVEIGLDHGRRAHEGSRFLRGEGQFDYLLHAVLAKNDGYAHADVMQPVLAL